MNVSKKYREFVRPGDDGNMGVYDQLGNRFIRENINSDGLPGQIVIIPSSTVGSSFIVPPENNAIGIYANGAVTPRINPHNSLALNLGVLAEGTIQSDFTQDVSFLNRGRISSFIGVNTAMYGFAAIYPTPDNRTGITAVDAAPIVIYSSAAGGLRYLIYARIMSTSGTSATYTITWTEGGAARTIGLTISAIGTPASNTFVIQPDNNTIITSQITALTSSTVNVSAIVSGLG